ncbi:hypothetical protein GE061_014644 [Apolygus lucorum]|uniref:Uncharacterized protein n=1 Tax=Apolygus lucorum TaxID=248454 RepID=A0A8S9XIS8_APOLU|nr:hypothetical protein GE061_014644 [Apolygus lucorum]
MQRPLSPVFGRALPSEMVATGAPRGQQKSRTRNPAAIGDPIDELPVDDGIDSPPPEGPLKVAEKIGKHLEVLEKSVVMSLKRVKNLQHHLYPTMSDNPESRRAVMQKLSDFNKKINSLCEQLRSLNFEEDSKVESQVRSDSSPIRTGRRLCASPVRKLQTWRI